MTIVDSNGKQMVEYKCNSDGLRVRKVATSTGTTDYTLHGKNIVHMTNGTNSLHFYYDAHNRPAVVEFNWVPYAYVHNLQGDIIAIVDANGNKVVEYKYDAWGKPIAKTGSLASTLGTLNPFRYRGYVYDEETNLYYLRSRYYSALVARFLNLDLQLGGINQILTHNGFAYCTNSPIVFGDPAGKTKVLISDYLEPFGANDWGSHTTQLPASTLILNCVAMAEAKDWKYALGELVYSISPSGKTKKLIDCIGLINLSAKFHMTRETYENKYHVKQGTKLALRKNSSTKLQSVSTDDMLPGSILYNKTLSHVGVYIGYYVTEDGTSIEHAVAHASAEKFGRVVIVPISESPFDSYCKFDYINYNLTYEEAKHLVNFPFWVIDE